MDPLAPSRVPLRSAFRRVPLRDAFRAAPSPTATGFRIMGPAGVLAERVDAAITPARRARGLLGRAPLVPGEALVIQPCSQIHTIGMRYPIDALFCDRDLVVLDVLTMAPGRLSRIVRRAWCCIELSAGSAEAVGVERGVRLRVEASEPSSP